MGAGHADCPSEADSSTATSPPHLRTAIHGRLFPRMIGRHCGKEEGHEDAYWRAGRSHRRDGAAGAFRTCLRPVDGEPARPGYGRSGCRGGRCADHDQERGDRPGADDGVRPLRRLSAVRPPRRPLSARDPEHRVPENRRLGPAPGGGAGRRPERQAEGRGAHRGDRGHGREPGDRDCHHLGGDRDRPAHGPGDPAQRPSLRGHGAARSRAPSPPARPASSPRRSEGRDPSRSTPRATARTPSTSW